jgi:hypothetical protein
VDGAESVTWTTLVAEYLAIGLQVLTWVSLFLLRIEGKRLTDFSDSLDLSAPVAGLIATLTLVFAYGVGTLFDKLLHLATEPLLERRVIRLWDSKPAEPSKFKTLSKLKAWPKRIWESRVRAKKEDRARVGREFYEAEDDMQGAEGERARLARRRSRIRIVRAQLLNLPLTILAIWMHVDVSLFLSRGLLIASVLLFPLVLGVFLAVHREYIQMIHRHHTKRHSPRGQRRRRKKWTNLKAFD